MSSLYPSFLKWGDYSSTSKNKPDLLEITPIDTDTFETEYSINVRVKVDGQERVLPLHSFESKNKQLYKLWLEGVRNRKIRVGKPFKIHTWLGTSKNDRKIRRFEMVF